MRREAVVERFERGGKPGETRARRGGGRPAAGGAQRQHQREHSQQGNGSAPRRRRRARVPRTLGQHRPGEEQPGERRHCQPQGQSPRSAQQVLQRRQPGQAEADAQRDDEHERGSHLNPAGVRVFPASSDLGLDVEISADKPGDPP